MCLQMSTGHFFEERKIVKEKGSLGLARDEIALLNKTKQVPSSYKNATKGQNKEKWNAAIQNELKSLIELGTWSEEDLPHGRNGIDTKCVFDIRDDGRYKARLVVRGFKQLYGIDFEETFAPTAAQAVVRICLAISANNKWKCYHYGYAPRELES